MPVSATAIDMDIMISSKEMSSIVNSIDMDNGGSVGSTGGSVAAAGHKSTEGAPSVV